MIQSLKNNLINIPGWHTKRKIVVFESDDWGSIRMASKEAYYKLLKLGYAVDSCAYNSNDCLESNDDLERLFTVLSSVKDKNDNPAVITINNIVANPDFEKIKACDYQNYYCEPFTNTLERYPNHDRVKDLYASGIENKLVNPQFHGREHLNVLNWLNALKNGEKAATDPFDLEVFTVYRGQGSSPKKEFLDAMAVYSDEHFKFIKKSIDEGMDLFKKLWGFDSKTIIAPCYTWNSQLEPVFKAKGIKTIQTGRAQIEPVIGKAKKNIKRTYTGQRNKTGQIYTIRNAVFEPSLNRNHDWVNTCLNEINTAFTWNKPAIISAHRVNFIGSLNPSNSSQNLSLLSDLLQKIIKKWPDVEFMASDELTEIMGKN